DLVAHEFGHCLTIGHVGDGLEGSWGALPSNDIMAYSSDPPGLNKCVSTLDVEGVALRMSKYLDVNGDGVVGRSDQLFANDAAGEGGNPFQVQHPSDHLYASSTGAVEQCPQPDLGLLPAAQRTDWTPTPIQTSAPTRTFSSPRTADLGTTPRTSRTEPAPTGSSPATSDGATSPAPADQPAGDVDTSDGTSDGAAPADASITRVEGADRIATAVAASRLAFAPGDAGAAVIARADQFADGLAGTSLAVSHSAPTLLTAGSALDPRVAQELRRALPAGGQVFLLGGPAALAPQLDAELQSMGYRVSRLAGADRFETSVRIAAAQPRPQSILLATGQNYADALAAGAAAVQADGLVLLTDGDTVPPAVGDYLSQNADAPRIAIGGPAALAVPGAENVAGADRFETSVLVARRFFPSPNLVGLASGISFADALSGGALLGRLGAPLILIAPDQLPDSVSRYLGANRVSIDNLLVLGGESAIATGVANAAGELVN
ncbi:MAG TPA: cell wall-binding repeat-containing protein, partial [Acidimicrobiales bacterium]|nr:cell wall-binding repeat-containing protein [Acidimicrobiales bacterium]